jgi:hypothetical protein
MTDLGQVLGELGFAPQLGPSTTLDVQKLRKRLLEIERQNTRFAMLLLAMIGVLFVLGLVMLIILASEPAKYVGAGLSGLSLTGLLYVLRDTWRTKVQIDLLLILAGTLDPSVMQSVLKSLFDGLGKASMSSSPQLSSS